MWYMMCLLGVSMTRYALNLPTQLKEEAEKWAAQQGVSLNQFILWAVAEKVGVLSHRLDDPTFPHVTYRRGASGQLAPILRGTGLRVQTLVVAAREWGMSTARLASEYDLPESRVKEALAFYDAHRQEIDLSVAAEAALETEAARD